MKSSFILLAGITLLAAQGWAQQPSAAETAALIDKGRQATLAYSASLPDFVCTQTVARYRRLIAGNSWQPIDNLTITLSYSQQHEDHELLQVNGSATKVKYGDLMHGATSTGEFGSVLKSVFEPASQTAFHWDGWKSEKGARVASFSFRVPAEASHYFLQAMSNGRTRSAAVPYHGTLELDPQTGRVIRFNYEADRIPEDLGITSANTSVDYSPTDIAGRTYLLPVRALVEMHSSAVGEKNETQFRDYRKFEASSSIDFGPSQ